MEDYQGGHIFGREIGGINREGILERINREVY